MQSNGTVHKGGDEAVAAGETLRVAGSNGPGRQELAVILGAASQVGGDPWPDEPIPLQAHDTPSWPTGHILPHIIERFTDGVSTETQTDPGVAKLHSLPCLSILLQGQYEVSPLPTWRREPLALWTCIGLPTGDRKTSVSERMTRRHKLFDKLAMDRWGEVESRNRIERDLLAQQEQSILKDTAKAKHRGADDLRESLIECERLKAQCQPTFARRLLVDDVTPEALAVRMREQGGAIGALEAEGGIFRSMAGGYSKSANLHPIFLKAYSRESMIFDRLGRPSVILSDPLLSLGLMTQPKHLTKALNEQVFDGRGLIERFLWSLPESKVGQRNSSPPQMDSQIEREYEALIDSLLPSSSPLGDEDDQVKITLTFSPDAQLLIRSFLDWMEPRLGETGDLAPITGWASRLPGNVVRIATLWHIVDAREDLEVSGSAVRRAIRLAKEYLLPMALKTLGGAATEPRTAVASLILQTIQDEGWPRFRRQELTRAIRSKKAEQLKAGLELLEEYGYLRRHVIPTGGRAAESFDVHPSFFASPDPPGSMGRKGSKSPESLDGPHSSHTSLPSRDLHGRRFSYQSEPPEEKQKERPE